MVIALALAACGDDGEGTSTCEDTADAACAEPSCRTADAGAVTLVAEDLAWDSSCLRGVADEPLTITLENRDDGVQHNVHLTDAPDAPKTSLAAGPSTQELEVTLPEGDYAYVCDIHPNMVGRLEVADANPAVP